MSVWDRITGQAAAIAPLKAAVESPAAMTHAWLITGPPGSGRSVAARAFAAALQCPDGGCGTCHDCVTAMERSHADVTVMATQNIIISIAEVRELVSLASQAPSGGKWRVIIVEDADRMTERTSNVLLKAIEEPPARTVWLLCAPSPRDVIVTIRSRCRNVGLRIPDVDAVAHLLVERDGIPAEDARIAAMAAQSHIGMARRLARDPEAQARRARVLDIPTHVHSVGQAVIAAGELVDVAGAEAKALGDELEATERADLLRALGAEGVDGPLPPAIRAQVKQFDDEAKRRASRRQRDVLDQALIDLLSFYRDVLAIQTRSHVELVNASLVDGIADIASTSSVTTTLARCESIVQARTRLNGNVAPLLAIEALVIALVTGR